MSSTAYSLDSRRASRRRPVPRDVRAFCTTRIHAPPPPVFVHLRARTRRHGDRSGWYTSRSRIVPHPPRLNVVVQENPFFFFISLTPFGDSERSQEVAQSVANGSSCTQRVGPTADTGLRNLSVSHVRTHTYVRGRGTPWHTRRSSSSVATNVSRVHQNVLIVLYDFLRLLFPFFF